jgi:hypothetical protein
LEIRAALSTFEAKEAGGVPMEPSDMRNEFKVRGEEMIKKIKELIHEGNIRRIIIKDEQGKPYLEVPMTLGVVGVVLAPVWAAIGALAAMASNFKIEIVKREEPKAQ